MVDGQPLQLPPTAIFAGETSFMSILSANTSSQSARLVRQFQRNNAQVSRVLERLSTGKRINRPSDDPIGFVAAEQLRGDLIDLQAESRAASATRFRIQQQQSAQSQIQNVLNDLRGSLVSAADGFNSPAQSEAIQIEVGASLDAIDLIANRVKGVQGSASLAELREGGDADVINGDVAQVANLVEQSITNVNSARAAAAAYQRTQDTFDQLRQDQIAITTQAISQIEDADFAVEASNLVQGQILSQAAVAALSLATGEQAEVISEILESLDQQA